MADHQRLIPLTPLTFVIKEPEAVLIGRGPIPPPPPMDKAVHKVDLNPHGTTTGSQNVQAERQGEERQVLLRNSGPLVIIICDILSTRAGGRRPKREDRGGMRKMVEKGLGRRAGRGGFWGCFSC